MGFPRVAQELGGNEYEDIAEIPSEMDWTAEWQQTVRLNKKSRGPPPEDPAKGMSDVLPSAAGGSSPEVQGPLGSRQRSRSRVKDPSEPLSHGFVQAPHWTHKVEASFFADTSQAQGSQDTVFSVEIDMPPANTKWIRTSFQGPAGILHHSHEAPSCGDL